MLFRREYQGLSILRGPDTHNQIFIGNMENRNERIKKQCREEPEREIRMEGQRKMWNRELMKYYSYNETAGSPGDLKRYERLFNSEKTPGRNGEEQK
jgi:hypothetical protein